MTISNKCLSGDLASSTGFNGIWKAQDDKQKKSFEKILSESIDNTQQTSNKGFSSIRPHLSSDTISGMVKVFSEKNNISEPGKIESSSLSDEQNMIITAGNSSLFTRNIYSKLVSQLQNQAWDYQKTHYTKL